MIFIDKEEFEAKIKELQQRQNRKIRVLAGEVRVLRAWLEAYEGMLFGVIKVMARNFSERSRGKKG